MTEEEAYKIAFAQGVEDFYKEALAIPRVGAFVQDGMARLGKGVQDLGRRTSRLGQNVGDALQDRAADAGAMATKAVDSMRPHAPALATAGLGMASGAAAGAATTEKKPWENIPGMDKQYKKRRMRRALTGGALGMAGGGLAGHGLQTAHGLAAGAKVAQVRVFRNLLNRDD